MSHIIWNIRFSWIKTWSWQVYKPLNVIQSRMQDCSLMWLQSNKISVTILLTENIYRKMILLNLFCVEQAEREVKFW